MKQTSLKADAAQPTAPRRGVVAGLVYAFERLMPDPFVLSLGLTLVVILLALGLAPKHSIETILAGTTPSATSLRAQSTYGCAIVPQA